jgi:hypothetical protein
LFSALVPQNKWSGLTQDGTSQEWQAHKWAFTDKVWRCNAAMRKLLPVSAISIFQIALPQPAPIGHFNVHFIKRLQFPRHLLPSGITDSGTN